MPRRPAVLLVVALLATAGCGRVRFTEARVNPQVHAQAQSYPAESYRRIREDRERLRDGEPLRFHDSAADLRRREYERDFYEDFYESVREANEARAAPPPPATRERDTPGDGFGGW